MSLRTITTTDHAEITSWVERHGGIPCRVRAHRGAPVDLRIEFPEPEDLEPIGWESWFRLFDKSHLAFLYEIGENDPATASRPRVVQQR